MQNTQVAAQQTGLAFSVGGVLNRTYTTMMKRFGLFLSLQMIPVIIVLVLGGIVFMMFMKADPTRGPGGFAVFLLGILSIFMMIVGFAVQGAFSYAVYQTLIGNPVGAGQSIAQGFRRLIPLILLSILVGIIVGIGTLFFIVPGVILYCFLSVVAPVCVVEKAGVFASMSRSADLTVGCRLKIFGLLLLYFIGAFVVTYGLQFVVGTMISVANPYGAIAFSAILSQVLGQLVAIFLNIMVPVIYFNLREVKEGIALEGLARVFD